MGTPRESIDIDELIGLTPPAQTVVTPSSLPPKRKHLHFSFGKPFGAPQLKNLSLTVRTPVPAPPEDEDVLWEDHRSDKTRSIVTADALLKGNMEEIDLESDNNPQEVISKLRKKKKRARHNRVSMKSLSPEEYLDDNFMGYSAAQQKKIAEWEERHKRENYCCFKLITAFLLLLLLITVACLVIYLAMPSEVEEFLGFEDKADGSFP